MTRHQESVDWPGPSGRKNRVNAGQRTVVTDIAPGSRSVETAEPRVIFSPEYEDAQDRVLESLSRTTTSRRSLKSGGKSEGGR